MDSVWIFNRSNFGHQWTRKRWAVVVTVIKSAYLAVSAQPTPQLERFQWWQNPLHAQSQLGLGRVDKTLSFLLEEIPGLKDISRTKRDILDCWKNLLWTPVWNKQFENLYAKGLLQLNIFTDFQIYVCCWVISYTWGKPVLLVFHCTILLLYYQDNTVSIQYHINSLECIIHKPCKINKKISGYL